MTKILLDFIRPIFPLGICQIETSNSSLSSKEEKNPTLSAIQSPCAIPKQLLSLEETNLSLLDRATPNFENSSTQKIKQIKVEIFEIEYTFDETQRIWEVKETRCSDGKMEREYWILPNFEYTR